LIRYYFHNHQEFGANVYSSTVINISLL